jgi:hypothetical protein
MCAMEPLPFANVSINELLVRFPKVRGTVEPSSYSPVDVFVYSLCKIALLGAEYDLVQESEEVLDFLAKTLTEPECLMTAYALVQTRKGRLEYAESILARVLDKKPDYDSAQVAMAGVCVLQGKGGWLPTVNQLLATSLNPTVRKCAEKILLSRSN